MHITKHLNIDETHRKQILDMTIYPLDICIILTKIYNEISQIVSRKMH